MQKELPTPNNPYEINKLYVDTLFQYFYLFGIEPDSLDISDFNQDLSFLKKNFKMPQVLNQFPPYRRNQSYIDPYTVMNHCFPKGYTLIIKNERPQDEFFFFSFDNLIKYFPENKRIYFHAVVIYEPVKSYLEIKYDNKMPPFPKIMISSEENKKGKDNKNEIELKIDQIFVKKAFCFSSFVPFPHETKGLIKNILEYTRNNKIILPLEKLIEGLIFGIPRPLRAYFYISSKKTNVFFPNQKEDIDFQLREFNQYNFYSYPYHSILYFKINDIFNIYKSILLEIPILFFSSSKEKLTNIVEIFINLLSPLEYQNPYISILPDAYCGLIEREKSFIFGINHKLTFTGKDKNLHPTYFKNMHLNVQNKLILLCDIDKGEVFQYINKVSLYHVVNFNNLGIYTESNNIDILQCISKNIYSDYNNSIIDINLPEKITNKLKKEMSNFATNINKQNDLSSTLYSSEYNQKIGEEFFYNYNASLLINYYNYIYNDEENIKRIISKELLNKKEEDIDIEKIFLVNKFLHDNKSDVAFYAKFFKTRIFKNFIKRKYLNNPLDRYIFLHFDERIAEKKSKGLFSKKIKTEFSSSKRFIFAHIYQIKNANNFIESEIKYMKSHKDVLLKKYFQNFGQYNKIIYTLFPRLIYDNKFFGGTEYKPNIDFSANIIGCIKGYQAIENTLVNETNPHNFFSIYYKEPMKRYLIDSNKVDISNEVLNSLNKVWVYIFCLTFYYCDEIEKNFRFEQLMRFFPKFVDENKEIIPFLLITIKQYGNENMMIKVFESIKNIYYSEYCLFCSKFKNDSKISWELKNIDTTNSKIDIQYYRNPKSEGNKLLSEVKNIDYDINSLKKKTFGAKNNINNKEKVTFELFYKCQNCNQSYEMTNLTINLNSKVKSSLMICNKCQKFLEPKTFVMNGRDKIEFIIYSPIKLLNIVREITMEYGQRIDLDELKNKYSSFYWNCILYFYLSGLSFEMLLKYKEKDDMNENDEKKDKKKKKVFKKLQLERQQIEV